MHHMIFHNNRIVPLVDARLSPGQAGLFNGWGLFTTVRIYDGQPFAFERHWKRLSVDAARIQLPLDYSREDVLRHLQELVRANDVKKGCARIYFVYNKIGFWCSNESFPTVDLVMYTTELPVRQGAVHLGVRPYGRYSADPLAGVKVTSWLQNVWSLEQSHRHGLDEVVMLNESGQVAECTAANLFCVRSGVVQTPPLNAGCLPGVNSRGALRGRARNRGFNYGMSAFHTGPS